MVALKNILNVKLSDYLAITPKCDKGANFCFAD